MFRLFIALLAVSCGPAISLQAAPAAEAGGKFLIGSTLDLRQILPAPPPPESPAGQADLETVLQVQAARTPAQMAWAREVEDDSLYANARVLGEWFTAKNLPLTGAFFASVDADVNFLGPKKYFMRPRPPFADARVKPCVHVTDTSSYPSGHAVRAWVWAELLAEIFPESREALTERARAVCWGRVIGGAHFPSDTTAGRRLADAVVAELLKNAAVRAEIARCRAEAQPFLLKKAA